MPAASVTSCPDNYQTTGHGGGKESEGGGGGGGGGVVQISAAIDAIDLITPAAWH